MSADYMIPSLHNEFRGQRYELDLTRLCLNRGAVYLPLSMKTSFEAGPVRLVDAEKGEAYSVTFSPPRELIGLRPLFEAYKLQPNDTLIITVHQDGSEIEVVKRPRRKPPPAPAAAEATPESGQKPDGAGIVRDRTTSSRDLKGVVKEERRVRLPVGSPLPPTESFTKVTERVTARSLSTHSGQVEASEVDPVVDSVRVVPSELPLAEPTPDELPVEPVATPLRDRSGGLLRAIKTALRRPGPPAVIKRDLPEELRETPTDLNPSEPFPEESVSGFSRIEPDADGLSTQQHKVQRELVEPPTMRREDTTLPKPPTEKRETSPLEGSWHDVWQKSDEPVPQKSAEPAPAFEVSHEPTVVASGSVEEPTTGEALFVIERYLRRPETSAVVRIENIARQVRLPVPVTRQVMKQLASNPDAGVSPIRQDIYLVKRG
ncbi:MAG: hypothetical protein JSV66_17140 [Trueperaceae bacterium]|nr:MAG: hypothetical protein JSV66_17140 [Trueperaceae bacterium]